MNKILQVVFVFMCKINRHILITFHVNFINMKKMLVMLLVKLYHFIFCWRNISHVYMLDLLQN